MSVCPRFLLGLKFPFTGRAVTTYYFSSLSGLLIHLLRNVMSGDVNEIEDKFRDVYLCSKFDEDLNDDSKTAKSKRKCLYQAYSLANSL